MDKNNKLFIYGRRELIVLLFLAVMIALFSFTVGLHFGKAMGTKPGTAATEALGSIATTDDKLPNRLEVVEQNKGVSQAIDDSLNQAVHDEVVRTGVKLDKSLQVELPKNTKTASGGATIATGVTISPTKAAVNAKAPAAAGVDGRYTLQVGSYKTAEEAEQLLGALEAAGHKPYQRVADLNEKGRWFRVYLGGFDTKEDAEQQVEKIKTERLIESFVVTPKAE
jgi:cell division septation protein DedD